MRNTIHDRLKRATADDALFSWLTDADRLEEKQIKAVERALDVVGTIDGAARRWLLEASRVEDVLSTRP